VLSPEETDLGFQMERVRRSTRRSSSARNVEAASSTGSTASNDVQGVVESSETVETPSVTHNHQNGSMKNNGLNGSIMKQKSNCVVS
jgi:hypothetical protein